MTREEAIRRLEEGAPFSELYDEAWENALIMGIEALKSAPVILCKECKEFRRYIDTDITFCDRTESERKPDDFCSRAERRTDG